jgi:GNAT superfamily N-acetyltransferase
MKITFKLGYPIANSMIFEEVYSEKLQLGLSEKVEILENAITVYLFVDDIVIGESYGVPLSVLDEVIQGTENYSKRDKEITVYCYSNTILPKYQKHGFGSLLKSFWLGLVVAHGFKQVIGHARPGGSQALNAKFGASFGRTFKDWYGTGEDYRMYSLTI